MTNRVLDEKVVISIIREEWQKIKASALSEVSVVRGDKPLLTPGLKIVDSGGNLFTILSVGNTGAVIEDALGKTANVPWEKIEAEFKLQ